MNAAARPEVVTADPSLWSEKSQRSVSASWTKEYRDIEYQCWRCRTPAVFTAQDQKHTFEVKKAPIDQPRILCNDCWRQSLDVRRELAVCAERWDDSKAMLTNDKDFLTRWLELLELLEKYVPYKPDTAKKNMLRRLLQDA
jgi:hypothetical protein